MRQLFEEKLVKPHPDDNMVEVEETVGELTIEDDLILDSDVAEEELIVDEPDDLPLRSPVALSESSLSYYMQRIADSTPLAKEEEQELGYKIQKGDKVALDKLVNANLKFVISVAYKFKNSGLPMSDIINQGNLGLLEAAKRYDPEKGVKFISYAVWWIRQYIVQGIAEQSGTVRLPIKQVGNLFKINNAREKMSHKNGKEPTTAELATHLGMKEEDVTDIMRVSKQSLSLEAPVKDGETRAFVDFLESEADSVEEILFKENLKQVLNEMIDELDPREMQIIKLRFGFDDEEIRTLDELGKLLGVSRERIRQLESRALDKLKKKATRKSLQDYLAS